MTEPKFPNWWTKFLASYLAGAGGTCLVLWPFVKDCRLLLGGVFCFVAECVLFYVWYQHNRELFR